jgi:uncharacterized protein (DUF983 family)
MLFSADMARPLIRKALATGFRLRCPRCKAGTLFAGVFQMKRECPVCLLPYFREPGYYLGAMILNYAVTAALLVGLYLTTPSLPLPASWGATTRLFLAMGLGVAVSLATMRHAYSLWLSLDYWLEPWPEEEPE